MESYWKNIPAFSVMLVTIASLFRMRRYAFPEHLVIAVLSVNAISDLIAVMMAEKGLNNTICYNISFPLLQTLTIVIYAITTRTVYRSILLVAAILIMPAGLINLFFYQGSKELNTLTMIPSELIVAVSTFLWLRERVMHDEPDRNMLLFWFAAANLLYYTISIPVLSIVPWLISKSYELSKMLLQVNKVAYLIWGLIILGGILCKKKTISYS